MNSMETTDNLWWRTPVINRRAWQWEDAHHALHDGEWWQNAVIYQIVPWSFLDTTGNGKGDLNGIIQKLDYISSLGVDAIWLTPIYESPMDDLGYDIVDMAKVGSAFGSHDEFKRLLALAHAVGIKVILDQVWNHTSSQHPWFQESRQSRDNPRADWYVWADAKADGSPPNNWLSSFTGESAWQWEPKRQQYYLFNFLDSQPDLNWHNPEVVEAVLQGAKFWLDAGVDGLRIDAVNYFLHDPKLRDNPVRAEDAPLPDGVPADNPLARQVLKYSFNRPETLDKLQSIRRLVDQYPGVVILGEVTLCEDSIVQASEYVAGSDRLHLAYHSGLLFDEPMTAERMQRVLQRVVDNFDQGGTCWIVGNHDYGRLRSQWCSKDYQTCPPEPFYHLMAAVLLCLPGAFCLYQGDELGLPVAQIPDDIPTDEIKDPFGIALYPTVVGRDGSRTPMPWQADQPNAGFTQGHPWLPVPKSHSVRAVDRQHQNPDSLLNSWRKLLHWRQRQPALEAGKLTVLKSKTGILAFERHYAEQRLLCVFNITDNHAIYDLGERAIERAFNVIPPATTVEGGILKLAPYGSFFAQLKR
mgnify:FL=1